ncbi:MAG: hypothetical protein C0483_23365 [Pirellula sp.]|nr:hypothetical protein [Pirellula sp.]
MRSCAAMDANAEVAVEDDGYAMQPRRQLKWYVPAGERVKQQAGAITGEATKKVPLYHRRLRPRSDRAWG